MKKMLALLLALVMAMSLTAALAEGQQEVTLKVASI